MSFMIGVVAILAAIGCWLYFYKDDKNLKNVRSGAMLKIMFYVSIGLALAGTVLLDPKLSAISLMFSTFTAGLWWAKQL